MLYRNTAAPWLYAAGGVMLGLAGFKAVFALKRRGRARDAEVAIEPLSSHTSLQHSGENAAREGHRAFVREHLDRELEAVLDGSAPAPGEAYDAVAPDDLASEWLSRATEATVVVRADEPLDPELAELFREAGMSIVSEDSLNYASPDQLEAAADAELAGTKQQQVEPPFDEGGSSTRE